MAENICLHIILRNVTIIYAFLNSINLFLNTLYAWIHFYIQFLKKVLNILLGPILAFVLFYSDILTDFSNTIADFCNCNYLYGTVSLAIMLSSYMTTVIYLKFALKESLCSSLSYPLHHRSLTLFEVHSKKIDIQEI